MYIVELFCAADSRGIDEIPLTSSTAKEVTLPTRVLVTHTF